MFELMKCDLIDKMGDDLRVANAARVSFAKWKEEMDSRDESLIDFLARHKHESPFMHVMMSYRCTAPIPIARQLWKSHIGLASQDDNVAWNEESRRYITNEPTFFMPTEWRGKPENKKQGSGGALNSSLSAIVAANLEFVCNDALERYQLLLHWGVAPEQARLILPQAAMTSWIWTGSLMAFVRICRLRVDSEAQAEAQQFGKLLMGHCTEHFPISTLALLKPIGEL